MLDVDFGTFPFVTSSNTISAGVCTGLGIAPQKIKEVFGVSKAYCTRVGSGPFPTELLDETGETIRKIGNEFGSTTGRPRRCGWIDLVALQFAIMINGVTQIIMTKADILDTLNELKVCNGYKINGEEKNYVPFQMNRVEIEPLYKTFEGWNADITACDTYESLPQKMKDYINYLNTFLGVPVKYISNGPSKSKKDDDEDLDDDDDFDSDDDKSVKKGKASAAKKKSKDDDDDDDDDVEVEDEWEKKETEDDWDPDFDEFDVPKSKGKKAVGGKKAAKDEEDDFKVDDDFKDLGFDDGSVGGGGFDDDDDDF